MPTSPPPLLSSFNLVSIEISNLCPHSRVHATCPRYVLKDDPAMLPTETVLKIFDELGFCGFHSNVMFSVYNEPMIDPRLFGLMDKLYRMVPQAKLHVWASSYYLSNELIAELVSHHLAFLGINHYGPREQERAFEIPAGLEYVWRGGEHDDRLRIYEREPLYQGHSFCGLPTRELVIHHTGEVGLCCFDWKRSVVFGNVREQSLRDILAGEAYRETMANCASQGRYLPICTRCAHKVPIRRDAP